MAAVVEEAAKGELVEAVVVLPGSLPRVHVLVPAVVVAVEVLLVLADRVKVGRVQLVEDVGLVGRGLGEEILREVDAAEEGVRLDLGRALVAPQAAVGGDAEALDQIFGFRRYPRVRRDP